MGPRLTAFLSHNATHPFLLSCSLVPTPNSTWVPRLVLVLSTGDEVHFLFVLTQSTMIPVLVERAKFPGIPTGPHSSVVYTLLPGKGPAECELPEGKGTTRRASGILVSASCHKPYTINQEYRVVVFIWILFIPLDLVLLG